MNRINDARQLSDLQPMPRFDWERLIRRVRLQNTVKATALILASYADADGSRIWPGVEKLARVSCCSEPTIKRHLAVLRDAGLIRRTKQGNRWAGAADEYELCVSLQVLHDLPMIDPNELLQVTPAPLIGSTDAAMSGDHPGKSGDHQTQSLGITGDTPPEPLPTTTKPIGPVLEVTHVPRAERREKPIPMMGDDYRPTSPTYAQWRATRRSG